MSRSTDRDEIIDVLYRLAYASDDLDQKIVHSLYATDRTLIFEMKGHLGDFSKEVTPTQLCQMMHLTLSGFSGTQHLVTNPLVVFDDEKPSLAHAKAFTLAYHYLEQNGKVQSVTMRGAWHMDLEKLDGKWVIRKHTVERSIPLDHEELYEVARARAEQGEGRAAKTVISAE